jgi:3-hydroxyacyl-CoA dehydrogenase
VAQPFTPIRRAEAASLLRRKVEVDKLGKKSGDGYYEYD